MNHWRVFCVTFSTQALVAMLANFLILLPHFSVPLFLLLGNHRCFLYQTYIDLHSFLPWLHSDPLFLGGRWVARNATLVGTFFEVQFPGDIITLFYVYDSVKYWRRIIFNPGRLYLQFFWSDFFAHMVLQNLICNVLSRFSFFESFLKIWSLIFVSNKLFEFEIFLVIVSRWVSFAQNISNSGPFPCLLRIHFR